MEATSRQINLEEETSIDKDIFNLDVLSGEDEVECEPSNLDGTKSSSSVGKFRSLVWKNYNRKSSGPKTYDAHCKHCNKKFSAGGRMGTSHLKYHLNKCVPYNRAQSKDRAALDVRQQLLVAGNVNKEGKMALKSFKFDSDKSRCDLAEMILLHEYPFSIVEHVGFRKFVKGLQPSFKIFKRQTAKSEVMKRYESERELLYKMFGKLSCRFSFTSDMWTCTGQNKGYLALTCHFIDDEWTIQKRILSFVVVDEISHSGEVLAKIIQDRLMKWNLDKKIMCFAFDNASVNDVVSRLLVRNMHDDGYLLMDGHCFQVRCSCHIINLFVQDGIGEIRDVIHKVRESVKYVKSSPQRNEQFRHVCVQVKAPNRNVVQDVSTRWNSTCLMLESALCFKDAFARLAKFDANYKHLPSSLEWENARVVCELLKLFYTITKSFSGSDYPTSNIYFNHVCQIHLSLKHMCNSSEPFVLALGKKMMSKFEKYWSETSRVLSVASILDPRFKMASVEYYFPLIYGVDASRKIFELTNFMEDLYNEYCLRNGGVSQSYIGENVSNSVNINEMCDGTSGATNAYGEVGGISMDLDSGLNRYLQAQRMKTPIKSDLQLYLDEVVWAMNASFDILSWWKNNAPKYPTLSKVARDVLGIPVSTVASESAFSTGGRVLDQYRTSLLPSTVEALICGQDWVRCNFKDEDSDASFIESLGTVFSSLNLDEDCNDEAT